MDRDSIEPLDVGSWFGSVGRLSALTARDDAAIGSALRHAYHLVQLTPRALRTSISAALGEQAFEDLLETEIYDIAAQALVGSPAGLALVRQPRSKAVFAEVRFPDGRGIGCGQGRTMALAILRAWCRAALALDKSVDRWPDAAKANSKVVPLHPEFRSDAASLGV